MSGYYFRLDQNRMPVRCKWEEAHEFNKHGQRVVGRTDLPGVTVSTVFYGWPMFPSDSPDYSGPPLLFESLVMGGPDDGRTVRYASWGDAEAGHARMVEYLSRKLGSQS